ncbi:hypothetical protein Hanom_Chr09g00792801 [Helianthus anomalus]
MFLTMSFLISFHRMRSKCTNPDITTVDLIDVAYAPIDHNTRPPVVLSLHYRIATQYGAAQASTTINHQHPAVALFFKKFSHQNVVFKNSEGDDWTREYLAPSVYLENWLECTKLTAYKQLRVCITYFSSCNQGHLQAKKTPTFLN